MTGIRCRGVLFDLDGVLVDTTPAVARVGAWWGREHGFAPDEVAGKAAGARVLALRTTASDAELQQAGAEWIVDNCAELFLDSSAAGEKFLLIGRRTK